MEKPVGAATPSSGPAKCSSEDSGISMGEGGPREVYRINKEEFTKE